MIDHQKLEDIALILPFAGFFLLLPPVLAVFAPNTFLFGLPLLPIYLLFVWFALILAGFIVSRRLRNHQDPADDEILKDADATQPPLAGE